MTTPTPRTDALEYDESRNRDVDWPTFSRDLERDNASLREQCVLLAKLAADTPQFRNPWHCAEAIKLRDSVLANVQDEPRAQ